MDTQPPIKNLSNLQEVSDAIHGLELTLAQAARSTKEAHWQIHDMKVDLHRIKNHLELLPAIHGMLTEILSRLPPS